MHLYFCSLLLWKIFIFDICSFEWIAIMASKMSIFYSFQFRLTFRFCHIFASRCWHNLNIIRNETMKTIFHQLWGIHEYAYKKKNSACTLAPLSFIRAPFWREWTMIKSIMETQLWRKNFFLLHSETLHIYRHAWI